MIRLLNYIIGIINNKIMNNKIIHNENINNENINNENINIENINNEDDNSIENIDKADILLTICDLTTLNSRQLENIENMSKKSLIDILLCYNKSYAALLDLLDYSFKNDGELDNRLVEKISGKISEIISEEKVSEMISEEKVLQILLEKNIPQKILLDKEDIDLNF